MADCGFTIADMLDVRGVMLNIPPLKTNEQFTQREITNTRRIANLRVARPFFKGTDPFLGAIYPCLKAQIWVPSLLISKELEIIIWLIDIWKHVQCRK